MTTNIVKWTKCVLIRLRIKLVIFFTLIGFVSPVVNQVFGQLLNLDSLNQIIDSPSSDSNEKGAALSFAIWKLRNSDPEESVKYARKYLEFAREEESPDAIAIGLNGLGLSHYRASNNDSAIHYFTFCRDYARSIGNLKAESWGLGNLGMAYKRIGQDSLALSNYFASLEIKKKTKELPYIANSYLGIGNLYKGDNKYLEAMRYYDSSLVVYNEIEKLQGHLSPEDIDRQDWVDSNPERMAKVFNGFGNVYLTLGMYDESLREFQKALELNRTANDKNGIIRNLTNSALVLEKEGRFSEVEDIIGEAETIANEINSQYDLAIIQKFKGRKAVRDQDLDLAESYYKNSLGIFQSMDILDEIVICMIDLSFLYLEKEEINESITYGALAYENALLLNDLGHKTDATICLAQAYDKLGDLRKSVNYFQEHLLLNDTLLARKSASSLTRELIRYELAEREKRIRAETKLKEEIAANKAANQIQRVIIASISAFLLALGWFLYSRWKQKQTLITEEKNSAILKFKHATSEMKALRSQMNPHFIFNALQSIQIFLLKEKVEDANDYLIKFAKLMRAVLENSHHEEIPVAQDREALELYMQLERIRLKHPFTYSIDIDEEIVQEELSIPPLILQPFIENAIWHGLQHKTEVGNIALNISKSEDKLICVVEDNGVGRDFFKPSALSHLGKKKSLGLKITKERLLLRDQRTNSQSEISIIDLATEDGVARGTRVELIIPIVL